MLSKHLDLQIVIHIILKYDQPISLQRLEESTQLADRNYAKLKVESDRLEVHARKACNWWIWIMLIVVCATFLWMVIFMKMFPKR